MRPEPVHTPRYQPESSIDFVTPSALPLWLCVITPGTLRLLPCVTLAAHADTLHRRVYIGCMRCASTVPLTDLAACVQAPPRGRPDASPAVLPSLTRISSPAPVADPTRTRCAASHTSGGAASAHPGEGSSSADAAARVERGAPALGASFSFSEARAARAAAQAALAAIPAPEVREAEAVDFGKLRQAWADRGSREERFAANVHIQMQQWDEQRCACM